MKVLLAIARWFLAAFLGMAALGALFSGAFGGALIMLAGCALITPQGGAWVAKHIAALNGGLRQVSLGFIAFIVGMVLSLDPNRPGPPAVAASGAAQPVTVAAPEAGASQSPPPPAPRFQCESGASADGAVVEIIGTDSHDLRSSPNGERIVNEKATRILGETQYQLIDNSTKVRIECLDGDWARVQITSPEWLTAQKGWVERAALAMPLRPGEVREFTETDFPWDDDTSKAKGAIVRAVNRIRREDPRCKDAIYPSSVAKSDSESKAQRKTIFFVNCGDGAMSVNVYFDAARADDPAPFRAPGHIDHATAIGVCEAYAKKSATHPSTVDFSKFMDLSISDHPNGRTTLRSTFTAKNSFNLELQFNISCLFDETGFIEGKVWE